MAIHHKTGLSLSGGGYRATAFHLGTLKKLNSLGILSKISVISTISGGSIAGAFYSLNHNNFKAFEENLYQSLQHKNIIKGILLSWTFFQLLLVTAVFLVPAFWFLFTPYAWLFPVILTLFIIVLLKYQFYIFPVSKRIEHLYDKFYFNNKTLKDLPDNPLLVIGSTNLQTARAFTFSKTWMQDSTYQYLHPKVTFKASDFPLSTAVMASSCVPFAFTPISIDKRFFTNEDDAGRVHPVLVDGGVYDNQGIHKIIQKGRYACDTVITSDAGGGATGELTFRNTIALLMTTVEVFMSRIKKVQMVKDVYENAGGANKEVAYFSLGWDVENCIPGFIDNLASKQITPEVIAAHNLPAEWVNDPYKFKDELTLHLQSRTNYANIYKPSPDEKKIARTVGTSLASLSKKKVDCLIVQAEALTEIQVKLYCPSLN